MSEEMTLEKRIESQNRAIKEALIGGRRITPMDALRDFGCFRLSARIWDIRHKFGVPVLCEKKKLDNGKRVAEYYVYAPIEQ